MAPDDITIRPGAAGDREAITAIAREIVSTGTVFVFDNVADVIDYWYQPAGHIFIAEKKGDIVGTCAVNHNQKGRGAHIANAGYMVRQSAMGQGVGTALGRHSLQVARELGFSAMQFNMVVATNTAAIHLWKKLGFKIVGELPGVFHHPEHGHVDAFVMYRKL